MNDSYLSDEDYSSVQSVEDIKRILSEAQTPGPNKYNFDNQVRTCNTHAAHTCPAVALLLSDNGYCTVVTLGCGRWLCLMLGATSTTLTTSCDSHTHATQLACRGRAFEWH
jgi:hypothetical protein